MPHELMPCTTNYNTFVRLGCQVACEDDEDCTRTCVRNVEVQYPVEGYCPDEYPCSACHRQCGWAAEHWLRTHCQAACGDDWDRENPQCGTCLDAGDVILQECLDNECAEPCGPAFNVRQGQASRFARRTLRNQSLRRF
jgi:hypothetical protein